MTIALCLAAAGVAAFVLYGLAFHRGHVSGFREGLAVTKADLRRLDETHRKWRDLSERPHHYPCLLLLRTTNPMGHPLYTVRRFTTLTAYTTFCVSRNEAPTATLWYDIRRIS